MMRKACTLPLANGRSTEAPADGEIVSTRVFDAPREVVFQAFTDPDRLAQWWGPRGFTSTFHEFARSRGGHRSQVKINHKSSPTEVIL